LEATWGDVGWFSRVPAGVFSFIFYWFLYDFLEINVFDVDSRPRAITERKRRQNGAKREAKWEPKSIKNRNKKLIEILIDF